MVQALSGVVGLQYIILKGLEEDSDSEVDAVLFKDEEFEKVCEWLDSHITKKFVKGVVSEASKEELQKTIDYWKEHRIYYITHITTDMGKELIKEIVSVSKLTEEEKTKLLNAPAFTVVSEAAIKAEEAYQQEQLKKSILREEKEDKEEKAEDLMTAIEAYGDACMMMGKGMMTSAEVKKFKEKVEKLVRS